MSEHTQGRLEFVELEQNSDIDASYEISSAETLELFAHNLTYYPVAPSKADARRLVACWNACLGIPTEALESGEARAVRDELADIHGLTKQRDELLEALRLYELPLGDETQARAEFGDAAVDRELQRRAAIAKAEAAK